MAIHPKLAPRAQDNGDKPWVVAAGGGEHEAPTLVMIRTFAEDPDYSTSGGNRHLVFLNTMEIAIIIVGTVLLVGTFLHRLIAHHPDDGSFRILAHPARAKTSCPLRPRQTMIERRRSSTSASLGNPSAR
jgi:hypothetical protein